MPNGFGRGRGFGGGFGRGMGFGFRGMSPPWPYIGRGRGGLPRCGYFLSGAGVPAPWTYQQPYAGIPAVPGYTPYYTPMSKDEELSYLKEQAEVIKEQLKDIESRMGDIEAEKQSTDEEK